MPRPFGVSLSIPLLLLVAVLCSSSSTSSSIRSRTGRKALPTTNNKKERVVVGTPLSSRHTRNNTFASTFASTLNTSHYCDVTALDGHWTYGDKESTSFGICHSKAVDIFGHNVNEALRSMDKYGCESYRSAEFVTPGCDVLSTVEAFNILEQKLVSGSFVFVGDSLMLQQYVAAECDLNGEKSQHPHSRSSVKFRYIFDAFLRPNIPCLPACLQNSTFRLSVRDQFPDPCLGCREGKLISSTPPHHSSFMKTTGNPGTVGGSSRAQWWMQKLPSDTRVLVLSTGAWYNKFQGIEQGSSEYKKTLQLLRPIFRHIIDSGVMIIWLALPPMVDDISFGKVGDFGWDSFEANNALAYQSFREIGVFFLDLRLMMYERKSKDPLSSADGLHWCNLGRTGMPTIINQMILHLATVGPEGLQVSTKRSTISPQRSGVNKRKNTPL